MQFAILVFRADPGVDSSSQGCYDELRSAFVSKTHDQKQRFHGAKLGLFAASIASHGGGVFETARRAPVTWDHGRRCTVTDRGLSHRKPNAFAPASSPGRANLPAPKSRALKVVVGIVRPAPEPSPSIRADRIPVVEAPRRSSAPPSSAANTISAGEFLRSWK